MKKNNSIKKSLIIGTLCLFLITTFPTYSTKELKINVRYVEKIREEIIDNKIETNFVPGELIVKFKDSININNLQWNNGFTGISSIDKLNEAYGVKSVEKLFKNPKVPTLSNIYKLILSDNVDEMLAIKKYSKDPNIEYAEPNYIYHSCNIPNDPLFKYQWALNQNNDYDIDAPEAWDIEIGNSDVIIAIVDSGVDYNHSDLFSNIWINDDEIPDNNIDDDSNGYIDDIRGYDFVDDTFSVYPGEDGKERDDDPMDFHGHGTHCAGIAAAVGNNSIGITGLSWNSKIMAVRVGYRDELGRGIFDLDDVALGICYAVDNGANVISISFGGYHSSILEREVIKVAYLRGVVLVAAAGNEHTNKKLYPAAFNEVIAVASTDRNDKKASFSNYGNWVDVAAPGVGICSTFPKNSYANFSGTSMSAPYVAGLSALIKSKDYCLSSDKIRDIIEYSIDRLDPTFEMNRGRINARNALQRGLGNVSAIIKTPKHAEEIKGVIGIRGTADGEGFMSYIVEYSKGKNPETIEWTEIINSSIPVQNDELCSLDSTILFEGNYIIRLRLICSNGIYIDTIWILVNNIGNIYFVDDDGGADFYSIQDAVYNSGSGDFICVKNGTYNELVEIHKSIVLLGENKDSTFINGNRKGYVIHVLADNVIISGFTITNSSISGPGLFLENSNNCTICFNNIIDNRIGIKLINSKENAIYKNNILNNFLGIRVAKFSNKNTISKNNFMTDIPPLLFGFASYKNSYFNQWYNNYWQKSRIIPMRVPYRWLDDPLLFLPVFFHRCNFDWRPASKSHIIPPSGPYILKYFGGV